jgi:hypothetical protein
MTRPNWQEMAMSTVFHVYLDCEASLRAGAIQVPTLRGLAAALTHAADALEEHGADDHAH